VISLTLLGIIQILVFFVSVILMLWAGVQDKKTRIPIMLIPALIATSISAGGLTFLLVTFSCVLIYFLPAKVNKVIGKADLLLFASAFIIIILNQNWVLSVVIYASLALTIIITGLDKNKSKEIPFIHYFSQGYALAVIGVVAVIIGMLLGSLF